MRCKICGMMLKSIRNKSGVCTLCYNNYSIRKKREQAKNNSHRILCSVTFLVLMAGFLHLTSLPSASAFLGTFKQNSCVNIVTILNGSTSVNLSVYYPNNTRSIKALMTQDGHRFNYTFCHTADIGIYNYDYFDNTGNVYVNDFKITPNGSDISIAQSIIYFIFLIAAIGIFTLCLYYAIKIPWSHARDEDGYIVNVNDLRYLKLFLIGACYLLLMSIFGLLRGITANYIPEIGVYGFFEWIYMMMFAGVYPIMIAGLVIALMIFLTNKKLQSALERGIPVE